MEKRIKCFNCERDLAFHFLKKVNEARGYSPINDLVRLP